VAFTAVPSAGAKLRASVLSALISERTPLEAIKIADQTLSNSISFTNDNTLFLAFLSGCTYRLELALIYSAGTTADFKGCFTFTNAVVNLTIQQFDASAAYLPNAVTGYTTGSSIVFGGAGTSSTRSALLVGNVVTSGAGTLQWQFAQNSLVAENYSCRAGSHLILQRIL